MLFESMTVLWGTLAAAAGVIAVHLLSWRRPQPRSLPTARFVPPAAQRALSRRLQPSDLDLLALRLLAVVSIGLAVAGPAFSLRQSGVARVVIADRSRSVANIADVRDSVGRLDDGAAETRVILFDSLPVIASDDAWRDSSGIVRRGNLDAALITGFREAVALRSRFDSVEVVIISPLVAEEISAGTAGIVAAAGRPVRHVRVRSRTASAPPSLASSLLPPATDLVGAALRLATSTPPSWLRVTRGPMTSTDSTHAVHGGLVLFWPVDSQSRPAADGILSANGAVVGSFARMGDPPGTPVARWSDGRPAAAQETLGAGCVRSVAIGLPATGDAVLRPDFQRFVRDLAVPCDWRDDRVLDASELSWLTPPARSTPAEARANVASPITRRLLLLLALGALAGEWWLRRRDRGSQVVAALGASGRVA
jgi:hypothetical protein